MSTSFLSRMKISMYNVYLDDGICYVLWRLNLGNSLVYFHIWDDYIIHRTSAVLDKA